MALVMHFIVDSITSLMIFINFHQVDANLISLYLSNGNPDRLDYKPFYYRVQNTLSTAHLFFSATIHIGDLCLLVNTSCPRFFLAYRGTPCPRMLENVNAYRIAGLQEMSLIRAFPCMDRWWVFRRRLYVYCALGSGQTIAVGPGNTLNAWPVGRKMKRGSRRTTGLRGPVNEKKKMYGVIMM